MTAGILPARRVRRAPPLPKSVRVSAARRTSATSELLSCGLNDCARTRRSNAVVPAVLPRGRDRRHSAIQHRVDNEAHQLAGSLAEATLPSYKPIGGAAE